jgi:hypothetical protein
MATYGHTSTAAKAAAAVSQCAVIDFDKKNDERMNASSSLV